MSFYVECLWIAFGANCNGDENSFNIKKAKHPLALPFLPTVNCLPSSISEVFSLDGVSSFSTRFIVLEILFCFVSYGLHPTFKFLVSSMTAMQLPGVPPILLIVLGSVEAIFHESEGWEKWLLSYRVYLRVRDLMHCWTISSRRVLSSSWHVALFVLLREYPCIRSFPQRLPSLVSLIYFFVIRYEI